jgi:hypothetical protein
VCACVIISGWEGKWLRGHVNVAQEDTTENNHRHENTHTHTHTYTYTYLVHHIDKGRAKLIITPLQQIQPQIDQQKGVDNL